VESGAALQRFREIIAAQGGDPRVCDDPAAILPQPALRIPFVAERDGIVQRVEPRIVGKGISAMGGGRNTMADTIDASVGFRITARPGDAVRVGETLAMIEARDARPARAGAARGIVSLKMRAFAALVALLLTLCACQTVDNLPHYPAAEFVWYASPNCADSSSTSSTSSSSFSSSSSQSANSLESGLTVTDDTATVINQLPAHKKKTEKRKIKICPFRDGNCPFGDKCRFAHDQNSTWQENVSRRTKKPFQASSAQEGRVFGSKEKRLLPTTKELLALGFALASYPTSVKTDSVDAPAAKRFSRGKVTCEAPIAGSATLHLTSKDLWSQFPVK
jgi:hypothetical protein